MEAIFKKKNPHLSSTSRVLFFFEKKLRLEEVKRCEALLADMEAALDSLRYARILVGLFCLIIGLF